MVAATASADSRGSAAWSIKRQQASIPARVPIKLAPVLLALDDGSREADIGFTGVAAYQFLWFNRFPPPAPGQGFAIDEIQVIFPPGPDAVPGAAVQLVIFSDPDGDPTNGAFLRTAFDDVIQAADGTTFSTYPIAPPLVVDGSADLLIGVVNRFVISGVSPPSRPAALDTTASAGRSWVALWTGDPPDPPSLPSDDVLDTIDFVEPGNWMIRATGTAVPVRDIPSLGRVGLGMLAALLALGGLLALHRYQKLIPHRSNWSSS